MKNFTITSEQIVTISAGLVADELARRFGRYTETMTLSKWGEATKLGRGGIEASSEQQYACADRLTQFFGHDTAILKPQPGDILGDWAKRLEKCFHSELRSFRFHPASHQADIETRHNADDIWQDAAAVASLLQGRRRVVSLVPAHNLLGLILTVLAPNLLGVSVLDGRGKSPDELSHLMTFGDLVIATPTLWRYLAETLPSVPNNVMGLSFGERMSVDLSGRLRQRGLGAMRELYGATETGVLAWRDSPPDPFVLFDHWQRKEHTIIRHRTNGQFQQLLPMDDMVWQSPRTFDLGGRRDGAVQIGAINVFPQSIGTVIAEHPAVDSCEVRVSQRSGALDRLIADIKLVPGALPDQAMAWAIDEWCRERLRPPERPRIYTFVPQKVS